MNHRNRNRKSNTESKNSEYLDNNDHSPHRVEHHHQHTLIPLPLIPSHLPMFTLCWDDVTSQHYLFHPCTGESTFIADDVGDASLSNRNFSNWTRAVTPFFGSREMRDDVTLQRVLLKSLNDDKFGIPKPRIFSSKTTAATCIQSFYRQIRDVHKYRSKIRVVFEKYFDVDSGLHYFRNTDTGESQWHRPIGSGWGGEFDLPEIDFYGESGSLNHDAYEEKSIEPILSSQRQEQKQDEDNELSLPFSVRKATNKHLLGPYCRRLKNTPGRRVDSALGHKMIKEATSYTDKNGRLAVSHLRDVKVTGVGSVVLYDDDVPLLDGLRVKTVTVEPYMFLRSAFEGGVDSVLKCVERYRQNRHVVLFGMMSIGKMIVSENEDGVASEATIRAIKLVLEIVEGAIAPEIDDEENEDGDDAASVSSSSSSSQTASSVTSSPAIVSAGLSALASISDNYANRIPLTSSPWLSTLTKAMKKLDLETSEVYVRYPDGLKVVTVTAVTRHSIDTCIYGCKVLFNMSCDEINREFVADAGLPLMLYAMRFCSDDATVQHYGCLTLYNFVYRNEVCHYQANEDGVTEVLRKIMEGFGSDDGLRRACIRTMTAMEEGGWRGNLGDKLNEAIM